VSRAIHHQKANQPAALIDHRQRDLAAERLGLGHAGLDHLQARFMGEPVSGNKIGHAAFLAVCDPAIRNGTKRTKPLVPSFSGVNS